MILSFVELGNGTALLIEYLSAFVFGWVIFQAGMIKNVYNNYLDALKNTFFAEAVSMNFVMIGMIPVMLVLMHHLEFGRDPAHIAFWFSMGIATTAGGLTAYPINYWLVITKLKHSRITKPNLELLPEPEQKKLQKIPMLEQVMQHPETMLKLSFKNQAYFIGLTLIALIMVIIITVFFIPIRF